MSLREAAKIYDIPDANLRYNLSGYHGIDSKSEIKTLLTDAEEQTKANLVNSIIKRVHPVRKKLLDATKEMLQYEERGDCKETTSLISWKPNQKYNIFFSEETPKIKISNIRIKKYN